MDTQFSKPNIFTPPADVAISAQALVFNDIQFPVRNPKLGASTAYRVYRSADKKDFVEVEGRAAYDVLSKCGVEKPYRVVRAKMEVSTILKLDELSIPEDSYVNPIQPNLTDIIAPPSGNDATAEAAPVAEAAPEAAPAPEAPTEEAQA